MFFLKEKTLTLLLCCKLKRHLISKLNYYFILDLNSLINCNKFVVLVRLRVMLLYNLKLILFNA
jgi:hypothetical protein